MTDDHDKHPGSTDSEPSEAAKHVTRKLDESALDRLEGADAESPDGSVSLHEADGAPVSPGDSVTGDLGENSDDSAPSRRSAYTSPDEMASSSDTAILARSTLRRLRAEREQAITGADIVGDRHEVILVIRGMVERRVLADQEAIVLGRTDPRTRVEVDLDLTPYGALDRGVSRMHARLHLDGNHLYVTDLDSTNGTFLADRKLTPHKPELLRKGDQLVLGRLNVQVMFH